MRRQGPILHKFMSAAPKTMRCSAYALAEVFNLASWSKNSRVLDLCGYPHLAPYAPFGRVTYKFTSVSSDNIIDTGTTYGIRIVFTNYWICLTRTPTKWSTFKHSSGSDGLVAISAWGTTRMWLQEHLQLMNFTPCDLDHYDASLYGWASYAAESNRYSGLESVWDRWPQRKPADLVIHHLTRHHLSVLELAVDALLNVLCTHAPSASAFASIWGIGPHGTNLPQCDGRQDSNARLQHLIERCKAVVELWDPESTHMLEPPGSRTPSELDIPQVRKCFGLWKNSTIPVNTDRLKDFSDPSPCEEHSCFWIEAKGGNELRNLAKRPPQRGLCDIGKLLRSVFTDPGQDTLRNIPKRLIFDIDQKQAATRKVWKEAIVVGCLEIIHRIELFCEDVRVLPAVVDSIRPWEWRTAYIV